MNTCNNKNIKNTFLRLVLNFDSSKKVPILMELSSVRKELRGETRGWVSWRIVSRCVALRWLSRERNWHSRLNGNGRWFVRQSSFSTYARRSFSKQLQGERGRGRREGAPPALAGLPTRFCFPNALLHSLSSWLRRLLDIWTHTKNASVTREKGLGNSLRDSLPSLNERETLHTAQRAGYLAVLRSPPTPSSYACCSSRLFPSSGGRVVHGRS